ncbi:ComEC/Rec2-related protein [Rothia aeria]|uniref:ComEC/Rec2-related protein n=1 Tax=Rothia aeria TaxID=172042 RepID=A0A2Z5R068_9MICC|nr:ComEC/Rec2-related protein [Rothia aeria]
MGAGAAPQAVAHLCLIVLVLVAQSVLLTARGIDTDRSTLRQVQGASVRITGTVSEVRAADARTSLILLKAETAQLGHEVVPLGETVRVYQAAARKNTRSAAGSGKATPTPGTRVTVIGTVENRGAAAYLKEAYVYAPGEVVNPSNIAILRTTLREHAVARIGAEPAALTLGMAYGDDSAMPKTTRENYKLSGLSHLTAVSGANIAIMFLLGYRVGLLLRLPRRSLVFAGAGAVAAYTMLLGFEGSVVRSLTMGALGALALIRGTGRNTLSALTTALLLCLVFSPSLVLDMGFALSAVATASLVLVAPSLTRLLSAVLPHTLAELMAAATSASLWCAPLIVGMSGNVPLYGVAANLLAAPLVPLTMFAGLAAFGAWAAGFTPLADACLTVAALPAGLIERVSTFFAKAPGNPWQVEASAAAVAVASAVVFGVSVLFWAGDAWQYCRSHHGQWARENTRIPNEHSVQDRVHTPQNSARLIRAHTHAHPEASAQSAPPRPLPPGLKSPTRIARRTPPRYDG